MSKSKLLTGALSLGIAGTSIFGVTQFADASEELQEVDVPVVTDEFEGFEGKESIVQVPEDFEFDGEGFIEYEDENGNLVRLKDHEGIVSTDDGYFVFVEKIEGDGFIEYIDENGDVERVELHWTENQ